ncbi:restriction endonuclease [Tautonia plasticadhaerens]|uniref:Mrr restriction system protein n=1 Tax=Tautonia plasticadhaerens TaxID=2527974 RepID=A0A518H761_9BACT|nr:restriction endonuclease [Tautonia plasticadhaerens]QDV36621.1 Mrr restriction system protein [Tautonia plasticadhaerens]
MSINNPCSDVPAYHQLFNPVLLALRELGGSGSLHEINEKVVELLAFSEEVLGRLHSPEQGNEREVEYRLAWARTYLKKFGLIDNSSRGIWSLTKAAEVVETVDPGDVVRLVREMSRKKVDEGETETSIEESEEVGHQPWKMLLHRLLTRDLTPDAFERLVQRLLRESGFIQVEVTGRSGDGGIDGKGIARIHGLMSFHVIFQCKRYQGVVSSGEIRDFRGAMVGRADKGLFITTSTYSREAVKEATRDGAPPIDLLDGDQLADKLKELSLGVRVEMVEKVTIDADWFSGI